MTRKGRSLAVPVMLGNNRDEGRLFAGLLGYGLRLRTRGDYEKRVGRMYPQAAPVLAEYAPVAAQSRWQAYAELVTDGSFACPIRRLGQALATRAPVYAYEFDDPQAPFGLPRWPFATPLRSFHAAELVYVFQRPWVLSGDRPLAPRQQALSRAMQDYWGAFARHGDPNGPGRPAWPHFDGRTPLALSVDGIAPTHDFARVHRCDFWDAQAR
ncbi:carboxylesterase family protein [Xanthomonas sp. Kuri4-1]